MECQRKCIKTNKKEAEPCLFYLPPQKSRARVELYSDNKLGVYREYSLFTSTLLRQLDSQRFPHNLYCLGCRCSPEG